jgi:hypothetical protein
MLLAIAWIGLVQPDLYDETDKEQFKILIEAV